ncbi:MAG: phosphate acyltransferase [Akkermansiaceae bacterium]|jgi:phosphotransacetylase|nr:phosphate acyltransferase [Akkermansiaceae bacterium]
MNDPASQAQAVERFVAPLIDQLRRHPKRVVFSDGEDLRVIRVAERLVKAEAVVPILLGDVVKIRSMAKENGVNLTFVKVLEPRRASDFELFCQRLDKIERYRGVEGAAVEERVAKPAVFGSLMVQYGQADALVGGNQSLPAALFRAFLQCIKPLPHVPKMFGMTLLSAPHLPNFGENGLVFLADTGLLPEPTVEDLASIAVETGRLARHMLGREPTVALLSHSTMGSAATAPARKVAAATGLAKEMAASAGLEIFIEGEVQADVAMDPAAAEVKLQGTGQRRSADVLVFPNLDAGHIALKLLQHCGGAVAFGPLIRGLARPVAQVPRTASEDAIFGTAAAVAVEAIKYHELYPDGEV